MPKQLGFKFDQQTAIKHVVCSNWFILLTSSCVAIAPMTAIPTAMAQAPRQNEATPSTGQTQLENVTWQLVEWRANGKRIQLLPQNPITVTFDGKRLGGRAGCNSYGSDYQLQNSRLQLVGEIVSTMIACQPEVGEREQQYLVALKAARTLTLNGRNRLVIRYRAASGEGVLVFANQTTAPPSQSRLPNTSWKLDAIAQACAASAIATNSTTSAIATVPPITIEFTTNSIRGFAGCNQYNASYQQRQNQLQIGAIASTKKGCPPPQMQLEQQFLSALSQVRQYEFSPGGELRLSYQGQNQSGTLILTRTE